MARKKSVAPEVEKKLARGWQEISRKAPMKWEKKGQMITGVYLGMKPPANKNSSAVASIDTDAGVTRFWAPTILADILTDAKEGHEIRITCEGKIKTARGLSDAWNFTVEMRAPEGEE